MKCLLKKSQIEKQIIIAIVFAKITFFLKKSHGSFLLSFRKKDTRTEEQKKGRKGQMDGRKDRAKFKEPVWSQPGTQKGFVVTNFPFYDITFPWFISYLLV